MIEQILPSTFVYLQITTIPVCTPGQALHPVCGQQRPRELAQQGNSSVGCKYPSPFPQGIFGYRRAICCWWEKMLIVRDGLCRGMLLARDAPVARCIPLLRRESLLSSLRSFPLSCRSLCRGVGELSAAAAGRAAWERVGT